MSAYYHGALFAAKCCSCCWYFFLARLLRFLAWRDGARACCVTSAQLWRERSEQNNPKHMNSNNVYMETNVLLKSYFHNAALLKSVPSRLLLCWASRECLDRAARPVYLQCSDFVAIRCITYLKWFNKKTYISKHLFIVHTIFKSMVESNFAHLLWYWNTILKFLQPTWRLKREV